MSKFWQFLFIYSKKEVFFEKENKEFDELFEKISFVEIESWINYSFNKHDLEVANFICNPSSRGVLHEIMIKVEILVLICALCVRGVL
jgi:hypothetical protein